MNNSIINNFTKQSELYNILCSEIKNKNLEIEQLKSALIKTNENIDYDLIEKVFIQYFDIEKKKIQIIKWLYNGVLFRHDKVNKYSQPAEVEFYDNGNKKKEIFYKNRSIHQKGNNPAHIEYYKNGNIKKEIYYKDSVRCNNYVINGIPQPAYIKYFDNKNPTKKCEIFYKNGVLHRTHGPAYIEYHENGKIKTQIYYNNGKQGKIIIL